MIYILKDDKGKISDISDYAKSTAWEECQENNKELKDYLASNPLAGKRVMQSIDSDFIRVLEDVIDILIAKEVIKFTDLPIPVQNKLLKRRRYRNTIKQNINASVLLDNNSGII